MAKYSGLTSEKAKELLEKYGKNELKRTKRISPIKLFLNQFISPLILVLIAAAIISSAVGFLPGVNPNITDTVLILIIVLVSGILGFVQEYKAEKTIEALQSMAIPKAKVIRDGEQKEIPTIEIVPGDVILLEEGDVIPADADIFDSFSLRVNEAPLTGESEPVEKSNKSSVFMNTYIVAGNAKALVLHTGMRTKVGKIAGKLEEIEEEKTSFEKDIDKFSKNIFWFIVGLIVMMTVIGFFKFEVYLSILTAISLAVAAIPEGLPAIVALTLAIGAKSMSRKKALIRKLSVTESIGAVDIICADKTGTLTKNEMKVMGLYANDKIYDINKLTKEKAKDLKQLFLCGALCNKSSIKQNKYSGDPTEIALRKISDEYGFVKEKLEKRFKEVNEVPFSSERKMMSTVYPIDKDKKYIVYTKGAPEIVIKHCTKIYINGNIKSIDDKKRKQILKQNKMFASSGLRVLGFAFKNTTNKKANIEHSLVWIGLQAMLDPPRKGVKESIKECYTAGIRVIMLTGDNPLTAKAIAKEIGIESSGFITGKELKNMNDSSLRSKLNSGINIFARISPFDKLKILEILKKEHRVAMTGDGVNDALALKKASVGISMGIRGTEVAKQASDIILLDDDFTTIVSAVKEGRRIFDNIRKFINYLFVSNLAEILVIFLATVFLTLKEPILLPVQILWINLLTDGLPALALGADPAGPGIMKRAPRRPNEPIINRKLAWLISTIGLKKTIVLGITFFVTLPLGFDVARTTLFTGFILYEFVRIGTIRYQEELSWLSNKYLVAALAGSVLLHLILLYTPLGNYFGVVPLGVFSWIILITGVIVGYILAIWMTDLIIRHVKD